MIIKLLMIGDSGVGKTHLCCEIARDLNAALIDVDMKAEPIIGKIAPDITRYTVEGDTPFISFLEKLKIVLKSDVDIVIIDSLTELKDLIKRYVKSKIVSRGEFWVGGVERTDSSPKKIDPDLFVVTWELYPIIYDKIRDIFKAINTKNKSFIVTYHPPIEKASKGEIQMIQELKRICNMVITVAPESVTLVNDTFLNPRGEMSRETFIKYIDKIIKAESMGDLDEKGGIG